MKFVKNRVPSFGVLSIDGGEGGISGVIEKRYTGLDPV